MELNVVVEKDKLRLSKQKIIDRIKKFHELGYNVVGLNVVVDPENVNQIPEPPDIHLSDVGIKNLEIYTRLTVAVEDTLHTHRISQSSETKKYDILAIEPRNDKMLNQLCGGNFECDIITFDLSVDRLPLAIHRANFNLPISSGTCLEIRYGGTVTSQQSRINTFAHGQLLVSKTRQKNIIIGNGSTDIYTFCSPKEVSCLGLFFGLKENISNQAVYRNGALVIKHGRIRRNKNSQAVEIDANLTATESWAIEALHSKPSSSLQTSQQISVTKPEVGISNAEPSTSASGDKKDENDKPSLNNNNLSKKSKHKMGAIPKTFVVEACSSPAKRVKVE